MVNRPGGHQHSRMPWIWRPSPALEPSPGSARPAAASVIATQIGWPFRLMRASPRQAAAAFLSVFGLNPRPPDLAILVERDEQLEGLVLEHHPIAQVQAPIALLPLQELERFQGAERSKPFLVAPDPGDELLLGLVGEKPLVDLTLQGPLEHPPEAS